MASTSAIDIDRKSVKIRSQTKLKKPSHSADPVLRTPIWAAFGILACIYTVSIGPIQDCDETFNYWEPLHYITHGYGLQTWEYSPEYSIRSWTYILLHALPIKVVDFFSNDKELEFLALKCFLAIIYAAIQTRLYSAISTTLHPDIGQIYLWISAIATGFHHASSAFLPSTFAMFTGALGLTAFLDIRGGPKTAASIMWFGAGALLGWPFAGALILPFVAFDWLLAIAIGDVSAILPSYIDGLGRCFTILGIQLSIDAFFYRKFVVVPWRIVLYNVFSGGNKGPDIFGTEPWHFYIRNLVLNFNIWFLFAVLAVPLLLLDSTFKSIATVKQPTIRLLTLVSPFYLWFIIFTLQPHKEERFMFPAYPFLALNAAISAYITKSAVISVLISKSISSYTISPLRMLLIASVLGSSTVFGVYRTIGFKGGYGAPMNIYEPLKNSNITPSNTTVCLGKDWYRFPSSFYLPNDIHAKFVKNTFDGLLPGEFSEDRGLGFFPGTWVMPSGMNDRNEEDFGKYTDIQHCTFLVDSRFPSVKATEAEPDYALDAKGWEKIKCEPFLDSAATHFLARILLIPEYSFIPQRFRRVWGEHCLLKARR